MTANRSFVSPNTSVNSPEGPGRSFVPSIHGLRGLSALLVYFCHVWDISAKYGFLPVAIHWSLPLVLCGAHGVQLFFMISGFLITGSIINHANAKRFLIDRCIRIYPVFLVIHLLSFSVGPFLGYKVFSGITPYRWIVLFWQNLLFLPGIFAVPIVQPNAWSLSYEALFYLVAAFGYVLLKRTGRLYGLSSLCLISATILWFYPMFIFFLMGVCVFFFRNIRLPKVHRYIAPPALLLMFYFLAFADAHPLFIYAAAGPGLVAFWSIVSGSGLLARITTSRILLYFGTISYSFYLWHQLVTFPLKFFFARVTVSWGDGLAMFCFGTLGLVGTVVVSHLSYKLLETRLARKLKNAQIGERHPQQIGV